MTIQDALEIEDGMIIAGSEYFRKVCERQAIAAFVATSSRVNFTQPFEGRADQPAKCRMYIPRLGTVVTPLPIVDARTRIDWSRKVYPAGPMTNGLAERIASERDRWGNGADDNADTTTAVAGSTY